MQRLTMPGEGTARAIDGTARPRGPRGAVGTVRGRQYRRGDADADAERVPREVAPRQVAVAREVESFADASREPEARAEVKTLGARRLGSTSAERVASPAMSAP